MTAPTPTSDLDRELDLAADQQAADSGSSAPSLSGSVVLALSIVAASLALAGAVHGVRVMNESPVPLTASLAGLANAASVGAERVKTAQPPSEAPVDKTLALAPKPAPAAEAHPPAEDPTPTPDDAAPPPPAADTTLAATAGEAAVAADEADDGSLPGISDLPAVSSDQDSIFEDDSAGSEEQEEEEGEVVVFDRDEPEPEPDPDPTAEPDLEPSS